MAPLGVGDVLLAVPSLLASACPESSTTAPSTMIRARVALKNHHLQIRVHVSTLELLWQFHQICSRRVPVAQGSTSRRELCRCQASWWQCFPASSRA